MKYFKYKTRLSWLDVSAFFLRLYYWLVSTAERTLKASPDCSGYVVELAEQHLSGKRDPKLLRVKQFRFKNKFCYTTILGKIVIGLLVFGCLFLANNFVKAQVVVCPANTDLGTYDCTNFDALPDQGVTVGEITGAPYNIQISGALPETRVTTIDSDFIFYCESDAREITRSVVIYNDYNFNFLYDSGEEIEICDFTISTIADTTAPSFTAPADLTLSCFGDLLPDPTEGIIVDDGICPILNVGDYLFFADAVIEGSCVGELFVTRSWVAVDPCGNASEPQIQTITIIDDNFPNFTVPPDITLPCGSDPSDNTLTGEVFDAQDNCSEASISSSIVETLPDTPCPGSTTYIKRWEALDDCGNATVADQTIIIECSGNCFTEVCDCENNIFTAYAVAEPGTYNEGDYSQLYLITDSTGDILGSSMTGIFSNLSSNQEYTIYAVNLLTEDLMGFQNDILSGSDINDVINLTGNFANYCFDLNPNTASYNCICTTFVCPEINSLQAIDSFCEVETFYILAFDILNTEIANNGEADFNVLFGYYNGSVSNPNPYATSPDGLLNGGNAITPSNGTAGIGASLPVGTYTIVAYLTPNPTDGTCQPVAFTELVINADPVVDLGENIQACVGDMVTLDAGAGFNSYSWSTGETSQTINVISPGMYSVTVTNAENCVDSDDIMVVFSTAIESDNLVSICEGSLYTLPDGTNVSTTGNYPVTLMATSGCDSVVTTILTVDSVIEIDNPVSICEGNSCTLPDGTSVSAEGNYPVTLVSSAGCDSIITTILTVSPFYDFNNTVAICEGDSYTLPDGVEVSTAGTYTVTLTSIEGCDSIVNTAIILSPLIESNETVSICEGDSYTLPDGTQVNTTGTYPVTIMASAGCDTTFITTVNVVDAFVEDNEISICEGEDYTLPDGNIVSVEGSYPVTFTSSQGCDSIVTTVLSVDDVLTFDNPVSICEGDSYTLPDGTNVSDAGIYPVTLVATSGCDSIVTTNLIVNDLPVVNISGDLEICIDGTGETNSDEITSLNAGAGFISYMWSTGQTNQAIIVPNAGDYTVTVSDVNGCSNSATVTVVENDCSIITEVCDCENEIFTAYAIAEPGTFEAVEYAQVYILTDENGNVIAFNDSGLFPNLTSNETYYIYAANVKNEDLADFEANLSTIVDVENETGAYANLCYELNSNRATYFCNCEGFVCPEIGNVNTDSPFCVGEFLDITVTGISNILQTQNSEDDFEILIAAYDGEVTNPNPYTTTPDITLNGGNPVMVSGSTATLTGIGPLNNPGTFTVVAYLSIEPQAGNCRPLASAVVVISANPFEPAPNNPFTACAGESVTFTAPAGYDYLWATDATTQEVTVFNTSSLPVTITNTNGCSQTLTYESQIIDAPDEPQPQPLSICGANDVTLNGPDGYNYLWQDGSSTQNITVSGTGFYELTISNEANCTQILTYQVVNDGLGLPNPPPIGICETESITLEGPPGFSYEWSTGETTQSIEVSIIGTYLLTITDAECSQQLIYEVTGNGNLDLPVPEPQEICGGEFVSLVGPEGYTYLWFNGSTSRIVLVNATGIYPLEVVDADGCSQTLTYVVLQLDIPDEPQPEPIIACTGEVVNLQAPQGYSYNWQSGEQSSNLNVTESGTYNVEISNGCTQTLSFQVTFLALPTITATSQNPSACGIDDGLITLIFTGIADGTYDLTFKAGTFENVTVTNGSAIVTGLSEGLYNFITITDENGCSAVTDTSIELISPDFVAPPTVSGNNQYCQGDPLSSIVATGETKAIFTWYANEDLTEVIYSGNNYVPQGITETVYVTQTIDGTCESAATSFTITINPLPVLQNITITECANSNEVLIDLTAYEELIGLAGGKWSDNAGGITDPSAYMFTNFSSIIYTVANAAGCTNFAIAKLIINDAHVNTQSVSICNNPNGNTIDILAVNIWNEEVWISEWTTNGEIVVDPSKAEITSNEQVFELITEANGACDTKNLLIVNIEEAPIVEAVASCRNSNDLNQFYIDVFTTKNPSFNSIIISDGNTQQTALGNNQVTFGPYTHSGTGLADIEFEAYFEENQTCPVTVSANEILCGPAISCACKDPGNAGRILAQSEPGTFNNENYTQIYVLTSVDGEIYSSNNTGLFTTLANDDYQVYALNVDSFDSYALNVAVNSESNISTFIPSKSYNNFCYEISEPYSYTVACDCLPFVCPSINSVEISGDVCAGETFDVTVNEVTDALFVSNNFTDYQMFIGYYAGFVAWPDPYNTAPDGLLNNGNAIDLGYNDPQLNDLGADLPAGNYTVVAYLSPTPGEDSCTPMARNFIKIHERPSLNPTVDPICVDHNGVIHPNISGGLFPYTVDWTTPAGETFTVNTFTIHLATLEDAGTYTVSVTDVKGCSSSENFEVTVVEDGTAPYQEVEVCEEIPGGAVEATVNLNELEAIMSATGGIWRDRSGSIVTNPESVSLAGTNPFKFNYFLETQGNCDRSQVLFININSIAATQDIDISVCNTQVDLTAFENENNLSGGIWFNQNGNPIDELTTVNLLEEGLQLVYSVEYEGACSVNTNISFTLKEGITIEDIQSTVCTEGAGSVNLTTFENEIDISGGQWLDQNAIPVDDATNVNLNEEGLEFVYTAQNEDGCTVNVGLSFTISNNVNINAYAQCAGESNEEGFNVVVEGITGGDGSGVYQLEVGGLSFLYEGGVATFGPYPFNGGPIEVMASTADNMVCNTKISIDPVFCGDSPVFCDCTNLTNPVSVQVMAEPGSYNTNGYSNVYLLTISNGTVIDYNTSGMFNGLLRNTDYFVYASNVEDVDYLVYEEVIVGASIDDVIQQNGVFANICYEVNTGVAQFNENCVCADCEATAGVASLLEGGISETCQGDSIGPFVAVGASDEFIYSYAWLVSSGAPDYIIDTLIEGRGPSYQREFEIESKPGSYCVHGVSIYGDYRLFRDFVFAQSITTGAELLTAIQSGQTCADVNFGDCIPIQVNGVSEADIQTSEALCNQEGGIYAATINLNDLVLTQPEIGTGVWYESIEEEDTILVENVVLSGAELPLGTYTYYYIVEEGDCQSISYATNINVLDCSERLCTYTLSSSEATCNADGTFSLIADVMIEDPLSDEFFVVINETAYGPFTDTDSIGIEQITIEGLTGESGTTEILIKDRDSDLIFEPTPAFISEIHYQNFGPGVGDGLEITALAGTDLNNYSIVLYNGNGGEVYNELALGSVIEDEGNGYGTYVLSFPLQNGPDGIVLVDETDPTNPVILEFISYSGSFLAADGIAEGMLSEDVVAFEPGEVGESLQLTQSGWIGPIPNTMGMLNENLDLQLEPEQISCSYSYSVEFPPCGACSLSATATPVNCETGQFYIDVTIDANNPVGSQFTIDYIFYGFVFTNYGNFDYSSGTVNIGPLPADGFTSYEFLVSDVESPDCQTSFIMEPQSCTVNRDTGLDDLPSTGSVFDDLVIINQSEQGDTLNENKGGKGSKEVPNGTVSKWKTTIDYLKPNPVTNNLYIGINSVAASNIDFVIVDATGRVLMRNLHAANKGINEIELDVKEYVPGIYFIRILQGDTLVYKKFIKD